jgi:hypothetical protein
MIVKKERTNERRTCPLPDPLKNRFQQLLEAYIEESTRARVSRADFERHCLIQAIEEEYGESWREKIAVKYRFPDQTGYFGLHLKVFGHDLIFKRLGLYKDIAENVVVVYKRGHWNVLKNGVGACRIWVLPDPLKNRFQLVLEAYSKDSTRARVSTADFERHCLIKAIEEEYGGSWRNDFASKKASLDSVYLLCSPYSYLENGGKYPFYFTRDNILRWSILKLNVIEETLKATAEQNVVVSVVCFMAGQSLL